MDESANENRQIDSDQPGQLGGALPHPEVPAGLRGRVQASLIAKDLLEARRSPRWRAPLVAALAAGIVFFVLGFGLGARRSPAARASTGVQGSTARVDSSNAVARTRYALLFYDATSADSGQADIEAHRQWATALAKEGRQISGEKLDTDAYVMKGQREWRAEPSASESQLRGLFFITAATEADARAIARSSPHYRHGGRVVVRRIIPT